MQDRDNNSRRRDKSISRRRFTGTAAAVAMSTAVSKLRAARNQAREK